jgi:hypothetical protein
MNKYLTILASIFLFLISCDRGNTQESKTAPKPTPKQIAIYIAAVNLISVLSDDKTANLTQAGDVLGKWISGNLPEPESAPTYTNSDTCTSCKSNCKKNGVWDFVCVAQCIWTPGICP